MKKLTTMLAMALMAVMTVTLFASCDEDDEIAYTLTGTWTGSLSAYYQDRWGLTGDHYRTTITFHQDGTGEEVDYDVRSPYRDYSYCPFLWTVNNGTITLRYEDSEWNPVYIYDYSLSGSYFSGYMDDGTNRDIVFRFNYDGSFNWNPYYGLYTRGNAEGDSLRTRGATGRKASAKGAFAKATHEE